MKKEVYEYSDYKAYLKAYIRGLPSNGHGVKSKMAVALGCHTAYVTQVLNRDAHFSQEQAEALNGYLSHTKDEALFFLLLVQISRAGSKALRDRLNEERDRILNARLNLADRVHFKKTLSAEDQQHYYSIWYYAAIHILITIPGYRNADSIAAYLGLSLSTVKDALQFLSGIGLIRLSAGEYLPGVTEVFLGRNSPMVIRHHTNWRLQALHSMESRLTENVHYSSVYSLSKKDAALIRDKLVATIKEISAQVAASPEEELAAINLDFFGLKS